MKKELPKEITKEEHEAANGSVNWGIFKCRDCYINTGIMEEYYMVRDDVWNAACPENEAGFMLCIGCLETRLGRRLVPADFTNVIVNMVGPFSDRLRDRRGLKDCA